jgi:energy-coupling factor transporter ATP-binding protein EcfA2
MHSEVHTAAARYGRGSEWRRWDLHVHTPYSVLNNGFGGDFDRYATELFSRAIDEEIAVIGVTDYFSIEGYRKLHGLQTDKKQLAALLGEQRVAAAQGILLLPNIELRLSEFVHAGLTDSRLNMHVIVSDQVPVREIEENFLQRLQFVSHSEPGAPDEKRNVTEPNLVELGARVKEGEEAFAHDSDLKVGMTQVSVSHTEITERLEESRALRGRHLVVLASDEDLPDVNWKGQSHHTRKILIQKSHMLWSGNPSTRRFALGEHESSVEKFEAQFNRRKPCIHGSDAHTYEKLFAFDKDRSLWVRADPTFDGLAQLLNEPEDRVYVNPEPPALARVRSAAAKIIDGVAFTRSEEAGPEAKWFSGELPLNPGLVAVIGKKGSGKSALSDAIALAGGAHSQPDFTFLNDDRFLHPRNKLGRHFEIALSWRSEDVLRERLDAKVDLSIPERVKYLPQSYLERICGELEGTRGRAAFDRELEAVIFAHVPIADRLGRNSLRELLAHKTAETESQISHLRKRLAAVNGEYLQMRRHTTEESKRSLAAKLDQRRADLEAHRKAKPTPVENPAEQATSSPQSQKVEQELGQTVVAIKALEDEYKGAEKKDTIAKQKKTALTRLLKRIENLEDAVAAFYDESRDDGVILGVDAAAIVSIKSDSSELEAMQKLVDEEIEELELILDPDRAGSLSRRRDQQSKHAEELRLKLDEPQRRFQDYQRLLTRWEQAEAKILGSAGDPKSIQGLEAMRTDVEQIPDRANKKMEERDELVSQIFTAKLEVIDAYETLHKPVQDHIDKHEVALEDDALSFSAAIAVGGFEDRLLRMINQRRKGSFSGESEGRERLGAMVKANDFSTADGVATFLKELVRSLDFDLRGDKPARVSIDEQLVQDADAEALYGYVFGLEYLQPRFELRWREKTIEQLSPGERGTLLLVFYLLVDPQEIPLIIDQPEENLDNETVAELLVPAVKYAKDRRQIILVTHNPNLAVVCDADQIIHVSIDKQDGNQVTYTSGAIEDPNITQLVVDVLEGTKPAFDLRDAKYDVLDRVA